MEQQYVMGTKAEIEAKLTKLDSNPVMVNHFYPTITRKLQDSARTRVGVGAVCLIALEDMTQTLFAALNAEKNKEARKTANELTPKIIEALTQTPKVDSSAAKAAQNDVTTQASAPARPAAQASTPRPVTR